MRACGGVGGAEAALRRRPPGRGAAAGDGVASDPALEAERAHLERVLGLGATTTVLFARKQHLVPVA
ncbi:hypothetical protein ACP4OV_024148 [Aristida adscensionis]